MKEAATYSPLQPQPAAARRKRSNIFGKIAPVYYVLIILVVVAALSQSSFLSARSIRNVFVGSTALGITSVGQTFVILTSGIDLSVGPIISLSNLVSALLMKSNPEGIPWIVTLCLGIGLAIGAVNGLIIAYGRVNPFILTLGMGTIIRGITLTVSDDPGGQVTKAFGQVARGMLGPIPLPIIYLIVIYIVGMWILKRTPYGLSIFAVGGNENSARLSGLHSRWILVTVYMVSGFMAAAAGLFLAARIGSGDPLIGESFTLDAVTATVLGGTSLAGGSGGLVGTLAGVLVINILNTMLNLNNISTFYQWIIKGVILIISLAIDFWRKHNRR